MKKVDRESKSQKLIDFIGTFPKFIDEMEFNISIKRRNRLTTFLNQKWINNLMILVSLILTVLNSVFNHQHIEDNSINYELQVLKNFDIFYYLSYLHLLMNSMMLVAWIHQSGPLEIMDKWRAVCSQNIKLLK